MNFCHHYAEEHLSPPPVWRALHCLAQQDVQPQAGLRVEQAPSVRPLPEPGCRAGAHPELQRPDCTAQLPLVSAHVPTPLPQFSAVSDILQMDYFSA